MSSTNEILDWGRAENYLKECESAYMEAGKAGMVAICFVIGPTRDRFNRGERTPELYNDIFEIAL